MVTQKKVDSSVKESKDVSMSINSKDRKLILTQGKNVFTLNIKKGIPMETFKKALASLNIQMQQYTSSKLVE